MTFRLLPKQPSAVIPLVMSVAAFLLIIAVLSTVKDETIASAGWQTYSSMVAIKEDADLDLGEIKSLLQRVAKSIHQQPNRVKYVMNHFVIAVACHVKPLHKLAVDTANGIGKVAVDLVGACRIPFAPDQIKKFEARSAIGKKRKSPKC